MTKFYDNEVFRLESITRVPAAVVPVAGRGEAARRRPSGRRRGRRLIELNTRAPAPPVTTRSANLQCPPPPPAMCSGVAFPAVRRGRRMCFSASRGGRVGVREIFSPGNSNAPRDCDKK